MAADDKDRLDKWLDSALKQYGNVEPRLGMESRILANLAARNRSALHLNWRLALTGVAAIAVIALVVWTGAGWHGKQSATDYMRAKTVIKNQNGVSARASGAQNSPQLRPHLSHGRTSRRHRNAEMAASPRLQQFPSPRSLSKQEQLLLTYVKRFPKEAVEVAREQSQRERELEALYSSDTVESNLDQER